MEDRAAAGVGFVASGIALAVALFALPGGRLPGTVIAGGAVTATALRRYGLIDRRIGSAIAIIGGIGLLALAPYTAPDAALGSLIVGGAGGLTVAAAYADYRGVPRERLGAKASAAVTAAVVGGFGLLAILAWFIVVSGIVGVFTPVNPSTRIALSSVAGGLGTASVALLYVNATDRHLDYIDLPRPTVRDLGYVTAGVIVIIGLNLLIGAVFDRLGVQSAQHGILSVAESNPDVLLVLIPLAFVFIGPGEELLYRNVVQKSLYDTFSRPAAIVVASVIFAIVHVFAFTGGGSVMATVNALAIVFTLSLVLGVVYDRTGSVLAAALVHAAHDAIGFAATYAQLTGRFDPSTVVGALAILL